MRLISWYILEVDEIDQEKWKERWLPIKDIRFWEPEITTCFLQDGVWVEDREPIFPGYLLVSSSKGWKYIETKLNRSLLKFGKEARRLTEDEILNIKVNEGNVNYDEITIKPGEQITIEKTSYAGLRALFLGVVPTTLGYQARVVVDALERGNQTIIIPLDAIHAARS